jgi:hypothetical protein
VFMSVLLEGAGFAMNMMLRRPRVDLMQPW